MACVGGRSHGGDGGSEQPPAPSQIPNQCEGSVSRGTTVNKELRKAIRDNKNRPLSLIFEDKDQKTFKAVGDNQHHLYNYIGELLCKFPFNYERWDKIPEVHKTVLMPSLEGFFDLKPHLNDQTVITVRGKLHTKGSLVQAGLHCSFRKQWKDKKNKLKEKGFLKYGSVQEAREKSPPDDWQRSAEEWKELIDFWAHPKRMNIAKKNAQNRAKKKTTSHQGSKSFAQGRHEFMEGHNGEYEDVIIHWKKTHTTKDGRFRYENDERLYNLMRAMQQQVADDVIAHLTSDEIMDTVLINNDRGHIPGRGRIVTGTGSSHHPLPSVGYMTEAAWNAEREELKREAQQSRTLAEEARHEVASCKDFIVQFTAYFNKHQQAGTSSNFTPFNPRPYIPPSSYASTSNALTSYAPSSSTHPHNPLAEVNADPNLYQNIMNPDGCYKPVNDDEDDSQEYGSDEDNGDEE